MQDKEKSKKEKEAVINIECSCDETSCVRHGKCPECQEYHKKHPECGTTSCGK